MYLLEMSDKYNVIKLLLFILMLSSTSNATRLARPIHLLPKLNQQLNSSMGPEAYYCETQASFVINLNQSDDSSSPQNETSSLPFGHIKPNVTYSELEEFKFFDDYPQLASRTEVDEFNSEMIDLYNKLQELAGPEGKESSYQGKAFYVDPRVEDDPQESGRCQLSVKVMDPGNPFQRNLTVKVSGPDVSGTLQLTAVLDPSTQENGVRLQPGPSLKIHSYQNDDFIGPENRQNYSIDLDQDQGLIIKGHSQRNPSFKMNLENGTPVMARFPFVKRDEQKRGHMECRFPQLF